MNSQQALEILGLSSNTSLADLKRAYREQVKLWHPDRYSAGSTMKKMAEKNIQDANLAYALLKRELPPGARGTAQPSKAPRRHATGGPSTFVSTCRERSIRVLKMLQDRFPRIAIRPLLAWLQRDARNHYRPWYRYPADPRNGRPEKRGENFDTVFQKALRNQSRTKHAIRPKTTAEKDGAERIVPIKGVSTPAKPDGT